MPVLVKQHPDALPVGYPAHLEEEIELPDGETLWVRPIVPADAPALAAEFAVADDDTVYMRFFNPHFQLTSNRLRYLTEVDYHHHLALAAMIARGDESEGVAIARYVERTADDVEGAIVVKPEFRRQGVARRPVVVSRVTVGRRALFRHYRRSAASTNSYACMRSASGKSCSSSG